MKIVPIKLFNLIFLAVFILGTSFVSASTEQSCTDTSQKFWSPNKSWSTCSVSSGGKYSIIINGKIGQSYDWTGSPDFSPDNKTLAYKARLNNKYFVVTGTREGRQQKGKSYSEIESIVWNLDVPVVKFFVFGPSNTLAYDARQDDKWYVVTNDHESLPYDWARPIIFSPDGSSLAYKARVGNGWFIVVNDKPGKSYDWVGLPMFSLDSKHMSYKAKQGNEWFIVVDDKPGKSYDWVGFPMFSLDSKHMSYKAKQGNEWFVVVDGKPGKSYNKIISISPNSDYRDFDIIPFQPNSEDVVYAAQSDNVWRVVIGQNEGQAYDQIEFDSKMSNQQIVYRARRRKQWFTVSENSSRDVIEQLINTTSEVSNVEDSSNNLKIDSNLLKDSSQLMDFVIKEFKTTNNTMRSLASRTEARLDKLSEKEAREDLKLRDLLADIRLDIHLSEENVKNAENISKELSDDIKVKKDSLRLAKQYLISAHYKFTNLVNEIKKRQ